MIKKIFILLSFTFCILIPTIIFAIQSHNIYITPNLCWMNKSGYEGFSSNTLIFSSNRNFMAICKNIKKRSNFGRVYVWNLKIGKLVWIIKQKTKVGTAIFSKNNKFLITGQDNGVISVFDRKTHTTISQNQICNNWITALATSPINNQIVAIGSQDGSLILYDFSFGLQPFKLLFLKGYFYIID